MIPGISGGFDGGAGSSYQGGSATSGGTRGDSSIGGINMSKNFGGSGGGFSIDWKIGLVIGAVVVFWLWKKK